MEVGGYLSTMGDWQHRAKGLTLVAAVAVIGGLVVARNPEAVGLGVLGFILVGMLSMLLGLAWLFLTAVGED